MYERVTVDWGKISKMPSVMYLHMNRKRCYSENKSAQNYRSHKHSNTAIDKQINRPLALSGQKITSGTTAQGPLNSIFLFYFVVKVLPQTDLLCISRIKAKVS